MPTYKEALKKLSERKRRPRGLSAKASAKAGARRKKSVGRKDSQRSKKIVKKKPKKKTVKKKRVVRKARPKKSRPRSGSRQRSGKTAKKKRKVAKKRKPKKIHRKSTKKKVLKKKRARPRKRIIRKRIKKRKKVIKKAKPKRRLKARKRIVKKTRRKPKVVRRARKKKKSRPQKGRGPSIRRRRKSEPTKPRIYIGKGTLDQLFESQAKVKLLKFFFRNPQEMFQPKEIFKRLRSNITLLRQEMKKLEKAGLVRQKKAWLSFEKKRGGVKKEKRIVWHLNPNFDFFNELRDLILKSTIASKEEVVGRAKKIGNIKLLVLSGVFTGDETARADLLIVGDKINQRKLSNFIKELESEIGKEINCAVMSTKEFDYRYDMYDRFVRDLLDSKCEILIKKIELW